MLRAARFVSTLRFTPAPRVVDAMTRMADRLDIVSPERIQEELKRLLVGEHGGRGLQLVCENGLAERFPARLPALRLEHDPVHKHKGGRRHTLAAVERCHP